MIIIFCAALLGGTTLPLHYSHPDSTTFTVLRWFSCSPTDQLVLSGSSPSHCHLLDRHCIPSESDGCESDICANTYMRLTKVSVVPQRTVTYKKRRHIGTSCKVTGPMGQYSRYGSRDDTTTIWCTFGPHRAHAYLGRTREWSCPRIQFRNGHHHWRLIHV